MAPQVAGHGGRVLHAPAGQDASVAAPGRMVAAGGGDLHDPEPAFAKPQAEVDVLRPVEVALVEAVGGLEVGPPDELAGADGEVDVPPGALRGDGAVRAAH